MYAAELGRTSPAVTDGDATSLEVMGVAHGRTRLQGVRDEVHHNRASTDSQEGRLCKGPALWSLGLGG